MNSKKIFIASVAFCLFSIVLMPIIAHASGFVSCNPTCTTNSSGKINCTSQCTLCDFFQMLVNIYNFIVQVIATPLAVLAFLIGGICILVSGGTPGLSSLGKKIMWGAAIGLILVFLSWLIVDFVLHAIGYSNASNWSKSDWLSRIDPAARRATKSRAASSTPAMMASSSQWTMNVTPRCANRPKSSSSRS